MAPRFSFIANPCHSTNETAQITFHGREFALMWPGPEAHDWLAHIKASFHNSI